MSEGFKNGYRQGEVPRQAWRDTLCIVLVLEVDACGVDFETGSSQDWEVSISWDRLWEENIALLTIARSHELNLLRAICYEDQCFRHTDCLILR